MNHGQAVWEIMRVAEAFFGLTPEGRLDEDGSSIMWVFESAGCLSAYRAMDRRHDLSDPAAFADALVDEPTVARDVVRLMASCVFQP